MHDDSYWRGSGLRSEEMKRDHGKNGINGKCSIFRLFRLFRLFRNLSSGSQIDEFVIVKPDFHFLIQAVDQLMPIPRQKIAEVDFTLLQIFVGIK
jgi:hypothetical protein